MGTPWSFPSAHIIGSPRYYLCESCEVYGYDLACWFCGSEDLKWGHMPKLCGAATFRHEQQPESSSTSSFDGWGGSPTPSEAQIATDVARLYIGQVD